jgi:trehalose/maltose hydrolase-like predicted phosphorylase
MRGPPLSPPSHLPINPPPLRDGASNPAPAYLSNGVVGLRIPKIPLPNGVAVVNGFVGEHAVDHVAALNQAPYPLSVDLEVAGMVLSRAPERARLLEQVYDFGSGELRSTFRFETGGPNAIVDVVTFCSRVLPTVVVQETRICLDAPADIRLSASVDPTGAPGSWETREQPVAAAGEPPPDGLMAWRSLGGRSSCGIAYYTAFDGAPSAKREIAHDQLQQPLTTSYRFKARSGVEYRLWQIASLVPSVMHGEPHRQAMRLGHQAFERGYERLREENRAAWAELWRARIVLDGAHGRWQHLADAAFFYVHSSVHKAALGGTGIFGLSLWPDYHYYRGHVMWDTDTFVLPALVLTDPEAARSLLEFRWRHLDAARRHALMAGLGGIQFPWEADPLSGEEVSRSDTPEAIHEIHVSLDVALAFVRYVLATGDERFLAERAWPVIEGVLDWTARRAVTTRRGLEMREVIGVAERSKPTANSAWTNAGARRLALQAIALAEQRGGTVPDAWRTIGEAMRLPISGAKGLANHDGYRSTEEQGETPEGAAAIFPLGLELSPAVEEATLRFALEQAPRFAGRPMLSALLGLFAARIGDRGLALELLERGYAELVAPPFSETLEFSPRIRAQSAAPMLANTGGFLIDLLYGFSGLEMTSGEPEEWARRPVTLPGQWRAIEVDRLWVRGAPWSLRAAQGEPARLRRLGPP